MHERWFGAALLVVSGLLAGLSLPYVKVTYAKDAWAKAVKDDTLVDASDQTVMVPPWNSSEGWVGFNITLPNEGKTGYAVHGTIVPADGDQNPQVALRVVNATGLDLLTFDGFSSQAWDATVVYAGSFLDSTVKYNTFDFQYLDNSSYYIVLFRGLKNETQNRPILVSIKETWFEQGRLLELTPLSGSAIAAVALVGLGLIVYDLNSRKGRLKQRGLIRKYAKDRKNKS
jgi:hypothetical protein